MMTTALSRALPRTILAAGLALAGTIASFGVTAAPAQAQGPSAKVYSASLAAALESPRREVINGVVWNCKGDSCAAPLDGSRAASTCTRVVRKFGQVTRFATPKGEFSAEELQRCNAG
jgi:hypothetical protein